MHCAAPGLSTVLSWREAARRAAQSGGAEMAAERLERRRLGRKLRSMELKPREQWIGGGNFAIKIWIKFYLTSEIMIWASEFRMEPSKYLE